MKNSKTLITRSSLDQLKKVKWDDGRMRVRLARMANDTEKAVLSINEGRQDLAGKFLEKYRKRIGAEANGKLDSIPPGEPENQEFFDEYQKVLDDSQEVKIRLKIPEEWLFDFDSEGEYPSSDAIQMLLPYIKPAKESSDDDPPADAEEPAKAAKPAKKDQ